MLGVLDVVMDLDHLDEEFALLQRRTVATAAVEILLMGALIALFTRRFISRPIRELIAGTKAVSAMKLDRPIVVETGGELDELADSFNSTPAQTRGEAW